MPRILVIIIALLGFRAEAQTYQQYLNAAQEAARSGKHYAAVQYYRKALELEPEEALVWFELGWSLQTFNDYAHAAEAFSKAAELDQSGRLPKAHFYAGMMLKQEGKYGEALEAFQKFMRRYRPTDALSLRAQHELGALRWVQNNQALDTAIHLVHPGEPLNSPYTDFNARFDSRDSLFFSSLRNTAPPKSPEKFLGRIYSGTSSPEIFGLPIPMQFENDHYANVAFHPSGNKMLFNVCSDSLGKISCRLYQSQKDSSGNWLGAMALPEPVNLPGTTTTQAVFGKLDFREVIYFVSDRAGGVGEEDLWIAIPEQEGYRVVQPAKGINTPGKEATPYWDDKLGLLFFSSDWHYGRGGYDVFCFGYNGMVTPMPMPVNAPANDLYFNISPNRRQAWFTSNREGALYLKSKTCCNDLWWFAWNDSAFIERNSIEPVPVIPVLASGTPTTRESETPAKSADPVSNPEKNPVPPVSASPTAWDATVYFHNDEPNPASRVATTELTYEACYNAYLQWRSTYLKQQSGLPEQQAVDRFFEGRVEAGWKNLQEIRQVLRSGLLQGKHYHLDLTGFCSPLNDSEYNVQLSKRRIQAVKNWLLNDQELVQALKENRLRLTENPKGENLAPAGISDDRNKPAESVYSLAAASERRVKLILEILPKP